MFGIGRRPGEGLRCASSSADQTSRAICPITTEAVHRRMRQQLRTGCTQHVPSMHFIRGYRRLCATARAQTHAVAARATEEQHRKLGKPQPSTAATADTVLIVESPIKAHKIQKYLGSAFQVSMSAACIRLQCTTAHKPQYNSDHIHHLNTVLLFRCWQAMGISETLYQKLVLWTLQQTSR